MAIHIDFHQINSFKLVRMCAIMPRSGREENPSISECNRTENVVFASVSGCNRCEYMPKKSRRLRRRHFFSGFRSFSLLKKYFPK